MKISFFVAFSKYIYYPIFLFSIIGSVYSVVAVALERYYNICKPFKRNLVGNNTFLCQWIRDHEKILLLGPLSVYLYLSKLFWGEKIKENLRFLYEYISPPKNWKLSLFHSLIEMFLPNISLTSRKDIS